MKNLDRRPLFRGLTKTGCFGRALALVTTMIVFFIFSPAAHSAAPPGQWWNNNYGAGRKITITGGSTPVPAGYSVSFTDDTADLITNGYLRPDGNDWRIVYWNGSAWVELDRWVDDIIGDGYNSASTRTWFKTQAGIAASASDDNYYVYYGYAGETQAAPAAMSNSMGADAASNIFWYADDFEEHAASTDPDGWTDQGTEDFRVALHGLEKWFQVQTSNDWADGSTASGMADVGDAVWSAKIYYHQAGTNPWGGMGVHIGNGGVGRIVVIRDGAYFHGDELFVFGPWTANTDIHFPLGTQGRIELVTNGSNLDAYWYNPAGYSPEKVTIFTGYTMLPGTGKLGVYVERPWTSPGNDRWIDADDIIVRQYVTPEPTVVLGPETDSCPVVTNTFDAGPGSLRQCIAYANSNAGTTIVFDIPDTAPGYTTSGSDSWWRISPASALPAITAPGTIIDGTTQAANYGSDSNSLGPEIEIDGSLAGAGANGLTISVPGGNAAIRHLVVDNFTLSGILLQGGSTLVTGCYLGLEPDGDTLAGNNTSTTSYHGGIRIVSGGNTLGGTTAADRNIISGNTLAGIVLNGAGATGNQVLGNYIGLDAGGTLDRGNISDGEGIEFQLADGNTIGGTAAGARNVISGNASDGMEIDGSSFNVIQGNYIGTDYTGTVAIPNDRDGIDINSDLATGSVGNIIGGTAPGEGNLIRGNTINGVELRDDTVVGSTTDNSILGNLIYGNGQLGIDLEPVGVTANDAGDGDAGPNGLQNYPVISAVTSNGVSTSVTGTLNSQPAATYRLEFYSTSNPDPLGYGEGDSFLGTTTVTTDGTGNASFTANFSTPLSPGDYVTATATSPTGATSEFAANAILPLFLMKQALLAADGSLITNSSTLPRGTVFKFLIYTDNNGPARSDVSVRDVLDPAFAYSTGSLKVDNSVAAGSSVSAVYAAVSAAAPLTDIMDADVASVTGSTIDVGNRYVANGQLDIAANRIWALLFTVRMQ